MRCSREACSCFLERTLVSGCSEEPVEGTAAPLDFTGVNILGERSRDGATVAGIRWGDMTCTGGHRSYLTVNCKYL